MLHVHLRDAHTFHVPLALAQEHAEVATLTATSTTRSQRTSSSERERLHVHVRVAADLPVPSWFVYEVLDSVMAQQQSELESDDGSDDDDDDDEEEEEEGPQEEDSKERVKVPQDGFDAVTTTTVTVTDGGALLGVKTWSSTTSLLGDAAVHGGSSDSLASSTSPSSSSPSSTTTSPLGSPATSLKSMRLGRRRRGHTSPHPSTSSSSAARRSRVRYTVSADAPLVDEMDARYEAAILAGAHVDDAAAVAAAAPSLSLSPLHTRDVVNEAIVLPLLHVARALGLRTVLAELDAYMLGMYVSTIRSRVARSRSASTAASAAASRTTSFLSLVDLAHEATRQHSATAVAFDSNAEDDQHDDDEDDDLSLVLDVLVLAHTFGLAQLARFVYDDVLEWWPQYHLTRAFLACESLLRAELLRVSPSSPSAVAAAATAAADVVAVPSPYSTLRRGMRPNRSFHVRPSVKPALVHQLEQACANRAILSHKLAASTGNRRVRCGGSVI